MKLIRLFLALAVLGLVVGLAYVAQSNEAASRQKMTDAADKFLGSLSGDQKTKAALDFDDKEDSTGTSRPTRTSSKKPKHQRPAPRGDERRTRRRRPWPCCGPAPASQRLRARPPPS